MDRTRSEIAASAEGLLKLSQSASCSFALASTSLVVSKKRMEKHAPCVHL